MKITRDQLKDFANQAGVGYNAGYSAGQSAGKSVSYRVWLDGDSSGTHKIKVWVGDQLVVDTRRFYDEDLDQSGSVNV